MFRAKRRSAACRLGGEHGREVHVTRLVVRRVGVGDVVGQHFGTLGAEAQGLFVDTERFIEADAHVGKPSR
jgi:hypothetical protein